MWHEIGRKVGRAFIIKLAQGPPQQQPPSDLNLSTGGQSAATIAAQNVPEFVAKPVISGVASRMGARAAAPALAKSLGSKLPFGLSLAAGAPAAYASRNAGGGIGESPESTPQEQEFARRTKARDPQAYQALPQGYNMMSDRGGAEGLANAALAPLSLTAAAVSAVPGALSSANRANQGDSREFTNDPKAWTYLNTPKPRTLEDVGKPDNRGWAQKTWEDDLRPAGNAVTNFMARPAQTMISGGRAIGGELANTLAGPEAYSKSGPVNDIWGRKIDKGPAAAPTPEQIADARKAYPQPAPTSRPAAPPTAVAARPPAPAAPPTPARPPTPAAPMQPRQPASPAATAQTPAPKPPVPQVAMQPGKPPTRL